VTFTVLLMLLLGAQPVASDLYLPGLPAVARELGSVSSSLTVFMLAFGVGQLICGWMADRFGRRPVLLGGLSWYALCAVACALAPSIAALTVGRALQGLAMAAILVCARAAVRDLYAASDGPRVMARGLSGLGVIALLAPLLGALVVQIVGWRWTLVCMAIYAVVVLGVCWRFFGETRRVDPQAIQGSVFDVLRSRSFWAWTSLATTTYGGMFCFLLLSPAIYIDYFGLSPMAYGWVPASGSLMYFLGTSGCRHLLARRPPMRVVQLGSLLSLGGALIQLSSMVWTPHSMWLLLLGHWVFALGHGIHQPCGQAGAVGDFPHLAGRAVAWSGFVMMAVAFLVGQAVMRFMDSSNTYGAWPLVVPMLVSGVGLVVIAFGWLPRLTPKSA
jgi:DHA1 family bicyclomycin/chloramphenicol resistance-like MFS transporter